MDIKDVLNLVNAGFTAEMISKFAKDEKKDPNQDPKNKTKTGSKNKTKTEAKPESNPELSDELSVITKRLDKLIKAVQAGNTVDATAPTPKEKDVNDVILNLIKEV